MCGIIGILGKTPVNQMLYDGLTVLQHRGQDAAGIVTLEENKFLLRKANGLVKEVFQLKHMHRLKGSVGIGHVRYPTAGDSNASEAQPFYVNSPYGITLAHNGNITNAERLTKELGKQCRRHLNTSSDSEVLLNIFANELDLLNSEKLTQEDIFSAITKMHSKISGGYAVVGLIANYGLIAFRDPNGIRPLCIGKRMIDGIAEYIIASESVALDICGFKLMRDVAPGEAIFITLDGKFYSQNCSTKTQLMPCIFEFVYFARPDSFIDNISVCVARVNMGRKLGEKIKRELNVEEFDVVIPIPETSCDIALEIARVLNKPYRQGFVKNRYVGRTFIMPGQEERKSSVRKKLNPIISEFKDKSVLLIDDSIVRGTTSKQIIQMARDAGANKVFMASAAPEIRYPNVYGIDMPSASELIATGRNVSEIQYIIGADGLYFQAIDDLEHAVNEQNTEIENFECSVFTGDYVTNDVSEEYLYQLEYTRGQNKLSTRENQHSSDLEIYNQP